MSGSSKRMVQKSLWSQVSPTYRMLFGFCLVALIGLIGQTPKSIFGFQMIWPYAALWAAVGWASAGMSIRPMLLLCLLGIAQDISFEGPIAVFMIVNLATYGVAVWLAETFDAEADPLKALMIAGAATGVGFFVLWVLASATANHVVKAVPLIQDWMLTLILFLPLAPLFRLGGRPGSRIGASQ